MMKFNQWLNLSESKKKHKHKKHPYYCPGCGNQVFVHPFYGPLVYNFHDHGPHHCPTTNQGVPGGQSNAPSGTVAATTGAASAASAAVSSDGGGSSGGDAGGSGSAGV